MTRRELLAAFAAVPLLRAQFEAPSAPVSIARCDSYNQDIAKKPAVMFHRLGGIESLVRNKTVTIKVNMTGAPRNRMGHRAPALPHYTHPKVLGAAAYPVDRAGARRTGFVESAWATARPLEEVMAASGWDVRALASSAARVEFENTNALGKGKRYSRLTVHGAYMYPAYDFNHSYEDTGAFVSMAKVKNHATWGVTLSLKNCFGTIPAPIYGEDASVRGVSTEQAKYGFQA